MRRLLSIVAIAALFCCAPSIQFAQKPPIAHPADDPLDINTATARQLKALPGFGDAYVRRVIAGRPYTAKNQLLTRGVLPQSAYDQVASRIVAHRPPR
jgi:competence protein ComEA